MILFTMREDILDLVSMNDPNFEVIADEDEDQLAASFDITKRPSTANDESAAVSFVAFFFTSNSVFFAWLEFELDYLGFAVFKRFLMIAKNVLKKSEPALLIECCYYKAWKIPDKLINVKIHSLLCRLNN